MPYCLSNTIRIPRFQKVLCQLHIFLFSGRYCWGPLPDRSDLGYYEVIAYSRLWWSEAYYQCHDGPNKMKPEKQWINAIYVQCLEENIYKYHGEIFPRCVPEVDCGEPFLPVTDSEIIHDYDSGKDYKAYPNHTISYNSVKMTCKTDKFQIFSKVCTL